MASVGMKNVPHRLSIDRGGSFDVAGIDGAGAKTWSDFSPMLPDPEGLGHIYSYRKVFKIGDRFYVPFGTTSDTYNPNVYVYSWAVGEPDWTFEFSQSYIATGGLSPVASGDYNSSGWDCCTDGVNVYVGVPITRNTVITCASGIRKAPTFTTVEIFKGTTLGTWTLVDFIDSENFDSFYPLKFRLCASATEPGNVYIAAADGGREPCDINSVGQDFWAMGFGVSPSIPTRVIIETAAYSVSGITGPTPRAYRANFDICNDGDDVQVFYRRAASSSSFADPVFDPFVIRVVKPAAIGTLNDTTGDGYDFQYATSLLDIPTDNGVVVYITPAWTENSGRRQRALIAKFTDGGDIRGIDADGVTVHHLHDNAALDVTRARDDRGVQYSIDESEAGLYYLPGVYYDPDADEYWTIYQDPGVLRASVTNAACAAPERWDGFPIPPGVGNQAAMKVGQGPFFDDAFYVLAVSVPTVDYLLTGLHTRPRIIEIPICRGCMSCSLTNRYVAP